MLLCWLPGAAAWAGVAMVTDVQHASVAPFAMLDAGTSLMLPPDGRLTLVYLASGMEYTISTAPRVVLGPNAPQLPQGGHVVQRATRIGRAGAPLVTARPDVVQAAIIMRGPAAGQSERVLQPPPRLSWPPLAATAPLQLLMFDDVSGQQLYRIAADPDGAKLPARPALRAGHAYAWRVQVPVAGGSYVGWSGRLELASRAEQQHYAKLQQAAAAGWSERLLLLSLLQQAGLTADAAALRQRLQAERPELAAALQEAR